MTLALPYGFTKFTIASSGLVSYTPDDNQPIVFKKEPDNQKVQLYESPFTGYTWSVIKQDNRSWEIEIKNITVSEFEDEIEIFRGLAVTFTPHNDEPTITYSLIMTYCEHNYTKGNYYKDTVQITLTPEEYR